MEKSGLIEQMGSADDLESVHFEKAIAGQSRLDNDIRTLAMEDKSMRNVIFQISL